MKRGIVSDKKAQGVMALPFGLIFSIFLIVIFIIIAFIAVKYFLNTEKCSEVGFFYRDLEKQVNEVWKGSGADLPFEISLPKGIKKVCFADMYARITNPQDAKEIGGYGPESNIFLIPIGKTCGMPQKTIPHLNITKIIETKNPYCIDASSKIRIRKDIYESLVTII